MVRLPPTLTLESYHLLSFGSLPEYHLFLQSLLNAMSWIRDKMHPYTTGLLLVPTTAMLTCTSLRSPEDLGLLSQWPVKNRSGRVVLSGHCSQGWVNDFVTILITVVWHVIKIHSMDSICGESDKVFRLFFKCRSLNRVLSWICLRNGIDSTHTGIAMC